MPDLTFRVQGVEAEPYATAPALNFRLCVESAGPELIHTVALRCQIRIDPARRRYTPSEQEKLRDLFGEPERWGQTLRSMLWTHCSVLIPRFAGRTAVDMPVPCTFDLTVATAKYFHGLEAGGVPMSLLFSGTIFYQGGNEELQVTQIPWSKEAAYTLPIEAWQQIMDTHYPNIGWLCLRRDVFDRLFQYKVERGLPSWEETVEALLP